MISLFTSFDSYYFLFPYLFYRVSFIYIFPKIYKINFSLSFNAIFHRFFYNFFATLIKGGIHKGAYSLYIRFLFVIIFMNILSVCPFNFAATSQVNLVIFFSFSTWLGLNIFYLLWNSKGLLSHLVPQGTPIYLVLFLFLIEIIRNFIRPITLTVRLVANITAGHLLITLLSELVFSYLTTSFFYMLLNVAEFAVAIIQGYIFVTMLRLYYQDVR